MPRSSPFRTRSCSRGAVLPLALIFMVLIVILGLGAMRGTRTAMRLAMNDEVRIEAHENAQSLIEAVLARPDQNFSLSLPAGTQHRCFPAGLAADAPPLRAPFSCGPQIPAPELPADLTAHAYVEVYRESIGGQPTVGVNAVPGTGDSYQFRFARYRVTAGYERGAEGQGSAEVSQGVNIKLPSVEGMNLF